MKICAYAFLLFWFVLAQSLDFDTPAMIYANGQPVVAVGGRGSPLVADWNGDGLKDLIVGQYSSGHIKYYENIGTNASPVFGAGLLMESDGTAITFPSG